VAGDFSHTGGTIAENSTTTCAILFDGTSPQPIPLAAILQDPSILQLTAMQRFDWEPVY
jgi:hypothetical protein